jgi:magnesium transporter
VSRGARFGQNACDLVSASPTSPSDHHAHGHRAVRAAHVGDSPGTLRPPPDALPGSITVIGYGRSGFAKHEQVALADIAGLRRTHGVIWLDVTGIGDLAIMRGIGEEFGLHRLAIEDVVNVGQRAKVDDYGDYAFLVMRMIDAQSPTETEQFAMFVGPDFVVTFQERPGDCFQMVRQRLGDSAGQLQKRGADYLAYALLDSAVDAYFPAVEGLDERLQAIELEILEGGRAPNAVPDLHVVRRCLLEFRRAVWPLREATNSLVRGEGKQFSADLGPYLRDVHDHVVQLLDLLDNYREMTASLLELHLSMVNQRLNEVIKLLTVISTIFIPLTFVVGVYGMNFKWMPETNQWWGYPACLAMMLVVAIAMLRWFRKRGWI